MTPLEKIEFIEAHSSPLATSLCHTLGLRDLTYFAHESKSLSLKVIQFPTMGNLVINSCNYLNCDFDMLRGNRYNQIFLDRYVDNPLIYVPLLKEGGFIYCFERQEYVWDSMSIRA